MDTQALQTTGNERVILDKEKTNNPHHKHLWEIN